jgi:intracellular multiplication protein IcmB
MFGLIARGFANLSLMLRQPIATFCDLDTTDGDAVLTRHGEYVTFLEGQGLRRLTMREDVEEIAQGLRIELSGSLDAPGHAIQAWYSCDPSLTSVEIERNLRGCRTIAREIGMRLGDIFAERERLWPRLMRAERCYFILWSRRSLLTREERKQAGEEQMAAGKGSPSFGDAQNPLRATEIMSAKHAAFVQRVVGAFRGHGIAVRLVRPAEALVAAREAIYPETSDSDWRPILPGSNVMPRLPEDDEKGDASLVLWPSIADQLFHADAVTHGGTRVQIGEHEWASVDMIVGPEDPRPFAEIVARLNSTHNPWRMSMLVEGGGRNMMAFKRAVCTILGFVPSNRQIYLAFLALKRIRDDNEDILVKVRTSFATWAPIGETSRLRRQASTLAQRVEGWGNCQAATIAGDPLEGVMSTVPGMAVASTAPPAAAPLAEVLRMLPWGRPASPWATGAVVFRTPDGRIWPYDPAGSRRTMVMDLFAAPPGYGKSVLANTILLGLCVSSAAQGSNGTKLPLIGKLDIGPSAEGFIQLLQEALPEHRRNEAIYVPMQLADGYEVNVFDTQLGCRDPLPLEKAFLQNFLSLGTMSIDADTPFEGMDQMIGFVIDEVYRLFADKSTGTKRPKRYLRGMEPEVDAAIDRYRIVLEDDAWWWEVVDALCVREAWRLAELAQRRAVPLLEDLITAARSQQVRDMFTKVRAETSEQVVELFERYVKALIRKYPTLNRPTRLDFGPARVIVLDLEAVTMAGSAEADRQTSLMYLLGRHILGRNFFLRPQYISFVPALVKPYHAKRFAEIRETLKRLDYDEFHRTKGQRFVREQVERDRREGRKHGLQLAVTSQVLSDFGENMISQSTGRFILGAGDEKEADEVINRFGLTPASAEVVRNRLKGPDENGGGAPFLAVIEADNVKFEQMLVNSLGPVELWAFSTTPNDVGLRARLYERIGPAEARRRLARVFPTGTAKHEINRRKDERLRRGEEDSRAQAGVIEELADELINGRGLGIVLRNLDHEAQGAVGHNAERAERVDWHEKGRPIAPTSEARQDLVEDEEPVAAEGD